MESESLNMSRLNLSGAVTGEGSTIGAAFERHLEPDDDYCEYRDEIWQTLLQQDAEKQPIHLQSPQLAFRGALVQQLRDITRKLGLSISTLHSAVAQLDLFMDAHRLRSDRLSHVTLACLSLAAKSEEKMSRALTLKVLSKVSGVVLSGDIFRQIEWMVGEHVRWRLLAPTPVTFASLLAKYVVAESELTTRNPIFTRKLKRDGAKFLDAYLDLTLSDVRLKVMDTVDVGCACVACARADLGLSAWPNWLADIAKREHSTVGPIARLLQRMMRILKSRGNTAIIEKDQSYTSSLIPNLAPCTSAYQVSRTIDPCRPPITNESNILDFNNTPQVPVYYTLPTYIPPVDMSYNRIDNFADYRYYKSSRLLNNYNSQPSTSAAVKRGLDSDVRVDPKRRLLENQPQQQVLLFDSICS